LDLDGHDSISIAVLTDSQDDVELINGTLRDAGHAAHCLWIVNPKSLNDALASENIELIIINCGRYTDGIREVIKQKECFKPEIPVIAMQETAAEEDIEAAMRAGACDLVSSGHKSRLQSVVGRELRSMRIERALNSTLHVATEYKRQLKNQIKASSSSIAIVQDGIVVDANNSWLKRFKVKERDELVGMPIMDSFDADSRAAMKGALVATQQGKWLAGEKLIVKSYLDSGDAETHLELEQVVLDDELCVQLRVAPQAVLPVEPTKLVHDALQRDPTTLFYHRAQFLDRLAKRLKKKPPSGTHCLVYMKPDNFSEICKKVGAIDSEDVFSQFADIVRKRMHPRDVAGRFEGTAIMALLERGHPRDAQMWGKQLVEEVGKSTFDVKEKSTHITCTVGACADTAAYADIDEFVTATIAAYQIGREAGGNGAFLDETTGEDTRQQEYDEIWVKHLKSALMDDRFRLAQLPIAGLRRESTQMFDLLVRMLDEQGQSVLPSEFLPAAERNNLMKNIDRWMLQAAMKFCEDQDADRVFVRLSRQSITDRATAVWLAKTLDDKGFDCSRLVLQIPEVDAAKHIKQTRDLVRHAHKMGIGFALEHFGTEQDRFQILDLLKPDYIKVDGEIMHTLISDREAQDTVGRIVGAAKERGIKTIAERVENANAMAVLFQLGLDYMQGHYVQEPAVVLEEVDTVTDNSLAMLAAANNR
jgi:diguanylate cyclase (GGDEF)-like protein